MQFSQGLPLEFRNSIDANKYHNRGKIRKKDKDCTFKPALSEKSR
jgi:hypothetical protein